MKYKGYIFESKQRGFGRCWKVTSPDGIMADFCRPRRDDYQSSVETPAYVTEIGKFDYATSQAEKIIVTFESGNVKENDDTVFSPLNEI